MQHIHTALQRLESQARASTEAPRYAAAVIDGRTVSVMVATGFRNTGKDSLRWKVDGKVVKASDLVELLAAA